MILKKIEKKIKEIKQKNKLLKNKKGFSTGFTWVFGIVSLFGLGILYIVFSQVFKASLVPIMTNLINASATISPTAKIEAISGIDKYMKYFDLLPYIIFFVVIIFMLIAAIRKERESQFF